MNRPRGPRPRQVGIDHREHLSQQIGATMDVSQGVDSYPVRQSRTTVRAMMHQATIIALVLRQDACYDTSHFADVLYECRLIVMKIVFTASANAPSPGDKRRRNNFFH